jgi:hypothetical protein
MQKESESEDSDTRRMVKKLADSMRQLGLPISHSKAKGLPSDDEDGQPWLSARQKGDDGGVTDQLEACGYEVVPDVFEMAGSTCELINKVTR